MASVKVAVRVRPFNGREIDLKSVCIVEVEDKKTRLINNKILAGEGAESRERIKDFTFDYSYWSHNEADPHFASQQQLYNDLGTDVVGNAVQGYNACVFAYGQTGSGKTFTMMGSQNNPGLIPRICEALFASMAEGREAGTTYSVEVSYLEIYNERVKDLLQGGTHSLRVREHPKHGPYVQDLSTHRVLQYQDIKDLMARGNAHRTTASTHMNDTSSRSHAIFTVTFIQARFQSDTPLETRSKLHLVDLAGSERADATGATGQRLKEGAHINKSLVTLGSVISALAEQSGKAAGKSTFIPYRDSVLTWLLKDSLGGNSKTIMVATISPADVNYGETLSTLRYANRAKNIINKPTINEDPNVKLIRELREEIAKLKSMIRENGGETDEANSETGSMIAALSRKQAQEKVLTDQWTERWRETHNILQEQKTLGLRKAGHGVVLDSERPHLVLIDDDLLSTGVTLYHLSSGLTRIGSLPSQDIQLQGAGLMEEHCTIQLNEGVATLEPCSEAQCWVNSELVDKATKLSQGCVVVLGSSHMFRYNDPQEAARLRKEGSNKSHLNASRLSFLSRSATDLFRSYDTLPGMDSDYADKSRLDDSKISALAKVQKSHLEAADMCEMSTQTSLHSSSQPTSPVGNQLDTDLALQVKRKSSLTLPLSGPKEPVETSDVGCATIPSLNSTPASETFYTATSFLSPDPPDFTSPISPLPDDSGLLEGYKSPNKEENSKVMGRIAEDNEGSDDSHSHTPKQESKPSSHSEHSETSPEEDELAELKTPDLKTANSDLAPLVTSPILPHQEHLQDYVLKGSPAVKGVATSTPKTADARQEQVPYRKVMSSTRDSGNNNNGLNMYCYKTSNKDSSMGAEAASAGSAQQTLESESNNLVPAANGCSVVHKDRNGNDAKDNNGGVIGKHTVSKVKQEEAREPKTSSEENKPWHSQLEECEASALVGDSSKETQQLIEKLHQQEGKGNVSASEQLKELQSLHHHYKEVEDQMLAGSPESWKEEGEEGNGAGSKDKENNPPLQRPKSLSLDSTLLQEERLALLIEREVQRRVLEEVISREATRQDRRAKGVQRTSSFTHATLHPELRVLTPSEVRPYTSLSTGCEVETGVGNRLYQSAASADDLLLTSAPLQSPLGDYDLACGICVSIPGYEMRGVGSAAHWEYEVQLTAGSESWTVFRRYRRFRELHLYMCHKYRQAVEELYFPPRRLFGNTSERVVEERRLQLEVYLQQLIVTCSEIEGCPLNAATPSRSTLAAFSPFFQRGVFEGTRYTTS